MMRLFTERGFTLIELMIVVAIIAILAAIAYPSFAAQIRKSRRSDAISTLNDTALREERWRANQATYTDTWTNLGFSTAPVNRFYDFSITGAGGAGAPTATVFEVHAKTKSGSDQAYDKANGQACTDLFITRDGTKSPAACFSR